MKIVADSSVPFVEGIFEPYSEVVYKEGASITPEDVRDADALLLRTRTRCDARLLEGSSVKMISIAAIGMDNVDHQYCDSHSIFVQNASGAVAGGVMDYVFSALYGTASRRSIPLSGLTFGVIGCGSSGSAVEKMARQLGFKLMLCDPPRARAEGEGQFCGLDELLSESDIISLHVPLNESTRRMADASFFAKMKVGAFFINTAHGAIVCENDLIAAIPKLGPVVIDAWDNEPDINTRLMDMVDIATPHIAGYSYQGKLNSTTAAVRAIARFFGFKELFEYFAKPDVEGLAATRVDVTGKSQGEIASIFQYNYPIFTDDFLFRMDPGGFERIRAGYRYRREFYID